MTISKRECEAEHQRGDGNESLIRASSGLLCRSWGLFRFIDHVLDYGNRVHFRRAVYMRT